MAGFELDTPSESDVISTPDLDAGYTIDPMTGEKMFSGYRARKPSTPPISQINISPSYVSDEDSGPYIDGQPSITAAPLLNKPLTAAPLLNKPLTEAQKSAEELFYEQMVKANEIKAASNKSEKTMDNYLALIQAGLGMMGGTSPYAFANIGQGGSAGISYLANARKQQGLNERGLARNQMDLLTARQSMTTAKENRLLRERLGLGGLEEKHGKDVSVVQGKIDAAIAKAIKSEWDLTYHLPAVEKKMGDAAALGKKPDPEIITEYNRLIKKKADIEAKIRRNMPLPPRPSALGPNTSGVIKLD
jgi:hypothetical protein